MDEAADEPSDFEWRNLKKLAVLVLSSLVWKNTLVQNQIRPLGGIEAVLNCCSYDEHNPYIREHAIMCLRFLMEGNRENQERIRALEKYNQERDDPKGTTRVEQSLRGKMEKAGSVGVPVNVKVPDEVLDQQGYETYMDGKGQVMLRKRQPPPANQPGAVPLQTSTQVPGLTNQQPLPPFSPHTSDSIRVTPGVKAQLAAGLTDIAQTGSTDVARSVLEGQVSALANAAVERKAATEGSFNPKSEIHNPKALEELVQQVMRDLPAQIGRAGASGALGREAEEQLRRLDRGFDGSGSRSGGGGGGGGEGSSK